MRFLVEVREAQANVSTAQTNAEFIPARPGRHVTVRRIFLSSDTAMIVSLVCSETHVLRWMQYVGKDGGSSAEYDFTSHHDNGLDLNTSDNGNVFIKVTYDYSGD